MFAMQLRYRLRGSHGPTESYGPSESNRPTRDSAASSGGGGTPGSDAKSKQNQLPNPGDEKTIHRLVVINND